MTTRAKGVPGIRTMTNLLYPERREVIAAAEKAGESVSLFIRKAAVARARELTQALSEGQRARLQRAFRRALSDMHQIDELLDREITSRRGRSYHGHSIRSKD